MLYSSFPLVIYYTHGSVCMSILPPQFIPPSPSSAVSTSQFSTSVSPILPFCRFHIYMCCVCAKSLQSCPTLHNFMDYSPPGSSVHGILQARILEWAVISSSRESSRHGSNPRLLRFGHLAGRFFTTIATRVLI